MKCRKYFHKVGCKMTTIYDVAKRAGVSITTVSRVLNDRGQVSEKTRIRVQQAMADLGYVPNPAARSLTLGVSQLIALVVPSITNSFYATLAKGLQDHCYAVGYNTVIANTDGDPEKEIECIETLLKKQIDGICFARYLEDEASLRLLAESQKSTVIIGAKPKDLEFDVVGVFGTGAALNEAIAQLKIAGKRRLGYIGGPPHTIVGTVRKRQYQFAVKKYDLSYEDALVAETDFTIEAGRKAAEEMLSLANPPDMFFAGNDLLAMGIFEALQNVGLNIPDDVAVIGCDDIELARLLKPSLTTIRLPQYLLGKKAGELLLERITNPGMAMKELSMEVRLIYRDSTAITI